ncbi:hypothetical protein [Demequina flava]|uniref:hypothetical protein n=1 Tax=Demequina flava TaxID=1095025 RepID=UPI0007832020|nr:hypothetical protein [Demequina flava]
MPVFTLDATFDLPLDAAAQDVWAFVDDREVQARFHPQIGRIDVVKGAWGKPGCEFVTTRIPPPAKNARARALAEIA